MGWDQIYEKTLISYIGLNVIYSFPETWDLASGRDQTHDYRNSRVYQALLANILACYATSVVKQPHSQIFGLEPPRGARLTEDWWRRFGSFTDDNGYLDEGRLGLYGRISYDEFLILERLNHQEPQYDPDTNDIVEVRSILRAQGLPTELVLDIMEIAEYSTKRGVKVPHDPFHPDNRDRLRKYINYCWQLLVRCEMLTKELKVVEGIDWESLVTDCIINDLWGSTKDTYRGQLSKVVENEETHGRRRVFK